MLVSGNCLEPTINVPLRVIPMTVISYYSFQNRSLTIGFFKEESSCLKMLERKHGSLNMLLNRSLCWPGRKLQRGVLGAIPSSHITQTAWQASIFLPAGSVFPVSNPSYWKTEEREEWWEENKYITPISFFFSVEQNVIILWCSGQTWPDLLQGAELRYSINHSRRLNKDVPTLENQALWNMSTWYIRLILRRELQVR